MNEREVRRDEFSWGAGSPALASLIRFDAASRITTACCHDERILAVDPADLVGSTLEEGLESEVADAVRRSLALIAGTCGESYSQVGIRAKAGTTPSVWDMVLFALPDGTFTLVIRDVSELVEGQLKEQAYVRRLRDLAQKLERVADEERHIIAVELHDRVSQPLAAARMRLQQHQLAYRAADPEELERQHNHIMQLVDDAIAESRAITSELAPSTYYELGLCPALRWLGDEFERRYGVTCRVECSIADVAEITPGISAFIYRSVRELLANVVRHAGATEAVVTVASDDGWVRLTVRDRGSGFVVAGGPELATEQGGGFGLFSIREHADRLGGDFTVQSGPGMGTLVVLQVPI